MLAPGLGSGEGEAQTMGEDLAFGALLRRFRLTASLSQAVLAERAHVSTNAIAALERGRRGVPRPATVLLLADALCLGPAERSALIEAAGAQRADAPSPVASTLPPLPTPLTSFVGRHHELAEVQQMLPDTRVLTLTGVGGIGKTRLALEAARQVAGEVAFVELAPVTTGSALPHAVASVLGVREQPGRPITDALAAVLRPRRLLLALDNCEHLVASCAELADALLAGLPRPAPPGDQSRTTRNRRRAGLASATAVVARASLAPDHWAGRDFRGGAAVRRTGANARTVFFAH